MSSRCLTAIAFALLATAPAAVVNAETMTIEEFIAGDRDASVEPTPASSDQKPAVYVIIKSNRGGDSACRLDYSPDATVGSVISKAAYPNPVDFASVDIALHRTRHQVNDDLSVEAEDEILGVQWNAEKNQPTKTTDHRLKPGDRIVLTQAPPTLDLFAATEATPGQYFSMPSAVVPAPTVAAPALAAPETATQEAPPTTHYAAIPAPVPSPFSAVPQTSVAPVLPNAAPAPVAGTAPNFPTQVLFNILVFEDLEGSFAEFDQLRSRMPCMLADTATIDGTVRILEKHHLIRRVSNPKLVVLAGRPATIQIGSVSPNPDEPAQGIEAKVGARPLNAGLVVEFSFTKTVGQQRNEVQTSLIVPDGQTVVLKTDARPPRGAVVDDAPNDKVKPAVYVVLTPEIVK